MASHPRTRITLGNLKYDLERKRITWSRLFWVLGRMVKQGFWTAKSSGADEAEGAFDAALNNRSADFFCCGPPIVKRGKLSLVTDGDAFMRYYVHRTNRALVIDRKTRLPKYEKILKTEIPRNAQVKSGREFAWVTDSDLITKQLKHAKGGRFAARARDFLGLINKRRTMLLVEIHYPARVAKTIELAAPTALEGSCLPVYNSKEGPDAWGIALDLEHLCDGAAEAVHRPVDFSAEYTFRDLGPLDDDRVRTEHEVAPLLTSEWTDADTKCIQTFAQKRTRRKKK